MFQNTKLLIIASLLIMGLGFYLLWFGLKPVSKNITSELAPTSTNSFQVLKPSNSADNESVSGLAGEKAYVTKVVDGDTIHVSIGNSNYTVRLLGVDTPETVDPRKPVQCFGKEASNKAKELLSDKEVILQRDVSDTDMYKRWLRFIYLPLSDGSYLFVNDYLIREGYAKVLTIPPDVKFGDQFLDAQGQARENKKGLWGRC